jgi:hypothetical protein
MYKRILLASTLAVGLIGAAHANPIGSTLTFQLNLNQLGITGSAGTVTLTQISTTEVDVSVDTQPNYIINTGSKTPFAFQTDLSSSALNVTFNTPDYQNVPGQFLDEKGNKGQFSYSPAGGPGTPYGNFNNAIVNNTQNGLPGGFLGTLDFDVTDAAGISLSDFVSNNDPSNPAIFVADIYATNTPGNPTGSVATNSPGSPGCNTSISGETCGRSVDAPEPAGLAIFGGGLLGLGFVASRKRRA